MKRKDDVEKQGLMRYSCDKSQCKFDICYQCLMHYDKSLKPEGKNIVDLYKGYIND